MTISIRKRAGAAFLAAILAGSPLPASVAPRLLVAAATGTTILVAHDADAKASSSGRSSSSGGYSRSSSSSSRTPSTSSYGSSRSSGGYTRPSTSAAPSVSQSGSDRAVSRQNSSDALGRYRSQKQAERSPSTSSSSPSSSGWSRPSVEDYYPPQQRLDWYQRRSGWTAPPYVYQTQRSFGVWDAAFLWFMLNSLSTPSHADFFAYHRNDPGLQAWRAEADRVARNDPSVRSQLQTLDQHVSNSTVSSDANYLPDDVDPKIARAAASSSGHGFVWLLLALVLAGAVLFWLWKRRAAQRRPAGDPTMSSPLASAANILRHKFSGEGYKPSLLRVGMTITLDPTPFILAAGATKATLPDALAGSNVTSVERVGVATDGPTTLHRLYLPGDGMFQLALDANGQPSECRYFRLLDEVNPADEAEWGFWLDDNEGALGWPDFQTKDGQVYGRVWAPGSSRIEPRELNEEMQDLNGKSTRTIRAMLYGRPTGLAEPAPANEYILLQMVEQNGQAWIEVHAGIDVSPAALSLA